MGLGFGMQDIKGDNVLMKARDSSTDQRGPWQAKLAERVTITPVGRKAVTNMHGTNVVHSRTLI